MYLAILHVQIGRTIAEKIFVLLKRRKDLYGAISPMTRTAESPMHNVLRPFAAVREWPPGLLNPN